MTLCFLFARERVKDTDNFTSLKLLSSPLSCWASMVKKVTFSTDKRLQWHQSENPLKSLSSTPPCTTHRRSYSQNSLFTHSTVFDFRSCLCPRNASLGFVGTTEKGRLIFIIFVCTLCGQFFPLGNSGCFPQGKPATTESCYPTQINYKVHAGSFRISVIHQTLTWTTRIFNVLLWSFLCVCIHMWVGWAHQRRVSATLWLKKDHKFFRVRTLGLWI